jgi:hypothetical protein
MPEGHRPVESKPVESRSCMSMDPWLDRFGGHSPAEWRSWVYGSPAWQALGAQACRVKIVQGCVGLEGVAQQRSWRAVQAWGAWPGGDRKCLWIPGLKAPSHRDPAVLRGGSLG